MICLDANVLIEVILGRRHATACQKYIDKSIEDLAITMLSLDLVMYYAESKKLDLANIEAFLRLFIWLPIVESDAERALERYKGRDFEDALQIACALRENCNRFVTLDKALAKKYATDIPIDLLSN